MKERIRVSIIVSVELDQRGLYYHYHVVEIGIRKDCNIRLSKKWRWRIREKRIKI